MCFTVTYEHDLRLLRLALDHDLHVAKKTFMKAFVVETRVGLADDLFEGRGDLIDQRVVNKALWDVDDVVTSSRKQPNLRCLCAAPYGEP